MSIPHHPLTRSGVLAELITEYDRAKAKHGKYTLDGPLATDLTRLAALVEEVGEVAELLTYDHMDDPDRLVKLRKELIQGANVLMTWASSIEVEQ
jgi:hypothetical protein